MANNKLAVNEIITNFPSYLRMFQISLSTGQKLIEIFFYKINGSIVSELRKYQRAIKNHKSFWVKIPFKTIITI